MKTMNAMNLAPSAPEETDESIPVEEKNPCVPMGDLTEKRMAQLLRQYAPRIWMAEGEVHMPSSVEWALSHLERIWDEEKGYYRLTTKEPLKDPADKLDFFSGDLGTSLCYGFWQEKEGNYVDLSYFQYCPYDAGKVVAGIQIGNHVSDWEHVTVRLARVTCHGERFLEPIQVVYPAHSFKNVYAWKQVEKVDGTHPVAYSALKSHGMWRDAGEHVYENGSIVKSIDQCSAGTAWDTWSCLATYEYFPLKRMGRGLDGTEWPQYFDVDYENPDSLSVKRWGNKASGLAFGYDRLTEGPTGPQEKDALKSYVRLD